MVFLIGLIAMLDVPLIKEATAQSTVTLKVYDPTGAFEVTQVHAARLDTLAGKTICEIGIGWEAERTFPLIRELLQKQFPTVKIIDYTKLPYWSTEINPKMVVAVKAAGCQAVIIGNAG